MFFRYRARNYPLTLSASDQQRWDDYRKDTLNGDNYGLTLETLAIENQNDQRKINILKALFDYANTL